MQKTKITAQIPLGTNTIKITGNGKVESPDLKLTYEQNVKSLDDLFKGSHIESQPCHEFDTGRPTGKEVW